MAKVKLSKLIKSLHGKVGDYIYRLMPDGSTVVNSVSKKKRKSSPAQKEYRQGTFRDRTQWARWAHKEYPIYAQLAADLPMINAYNLALKDISHPPVIYRILRKDGRILVNAWDEIMVAGVRVMIHNEQGRLLEAGDAVQQQKDWWEYIPKLEGRISAFAWDLPGNKARIELKEWDDDCSP